MANIESVIGIAEVVKHLKEATEAMAKGCNRGLRRAGLLLQRESQKLVPVDYGVLKASAFTRAEGEGFGTTVIVGYTANYALFVHENTEMKWKGLPRSAPHKGLYWDPQGRGQSKFLETPMRRLEPDMRAMVADEMKIK